MFFTSWIERVSRSLKRDSRRKEARAEFVGRASECLEERSLLTVSALVIGGELELTLDTDDDVAVRENPAAPGTVQVVANGSPLLSLPTLATSSVTKILITGGDDANLIDLSGVTASAFSNAALSIEVHAGNGDDTVLGSADLADNLDGGDGDDSINGNGGNDTILGGDGNDVISGNGGDDSIDAGDGQDTVNGNGGNDTILAGDGEDSVDGNAGNDSLSGDDGADTLLGNDGDDTLNGMAGTDSLDGQNGNDSLLGGAGNDTLLGGSGADWTDGNAGNDLVYAEAVTGQAPVSTTIVSTQTFFTDFESGVPSQLSGAITRAGVQGYSGLGTGTNTFSGSLLHNDTGTGSPTGGNLTPQTPTVLTLTNLPTHTSIDINFLLAIINSWDGESTNPTSPDFFNVTVDGVSVFRNSFDNVTPTGTAQGYIAPPGVQLTPRPYSDLGFTATSTNLDSAWNMGLDPTFNNIPHTASSLTITFFADGAGFQGSTNESWGIDNLEVILNGVPVVTTIVSADSLFGGVGNDTLNGADGNDFLNGGGDADVLNGGAGNDSMLGGAGHDSLVGGSGDDTVLGQAGNDTLLGSDGQDSLDGGAGNDVVASGGTAVPVLISIGNANANEGNTGTTDFLFTVTLSSASTSTIAVDFTTAPGTAAAGSDFVSTSGTLTFAPGVTTQTIAVPVVGDTTDEFNENFSVVLSNPVDATISDGFGLGTIFDDDTASSVVSSVVATASATSFLQNNAASFGLTAADLSNFVITDQYTSSHNGVTHLYLQQTYLGIPIIDANINVNVAANGTVLSANSAFVGNVSALNLSATPNMTVDQAFAGLGLELAKALEDSHDHSGNITSPTNTQQISDPQSQNSQGSDDPIEPLEIVRTQFPDKLQWAKTDDGLELVWTINVQTTEQIGWYDASVSASSGELLHNVSWVSAASYNVINYNEESPLYAPRTIEVDPQDSTASPFGWHDTNGVTGAEFTDTRGNNVFAQGSRDDDPIFDLLFGPNPFGTGPRPDGGASLNFDFPFDDTQDPSTYLPAATANLFYTNNIIHDIHYQYGFDEASGNFQFNNYGNGGAGNDQVSANAQAGANVGYANNAFMATPPDGFNPVMAMFTWTLTNPELDGDFDNGIIIHEYGHGVSNRLTGGPSNANALNALQSGGMGEGWSDWWALMFTQHVGDTENTPRPVGNYVLGQSESGPGIRRFPYSFDMTVNPLTLNNFNGGFPNNEVHNAGEIWASVLWDMNWLLINGISTPDCDGNVTPGYGFDPDLYNGTGGNNIALQLVMDGLKLQPANPTFLQARDAILQADMINNGGANERAIWTAFARRGFGFSANAGVDADSTVVVAAFDMPPELGNIRFDAASYTLGDTVGIVVCDTDQAAAGTMLTVTVTTDTGDSEQVVLTRQADQTFTGSIQLQRASVTQNNGILDMPTEGALLTAFYTDPNDGTNTTVTLTALAAVNAGLGDTLLGGDGNDSLIGGSGDDFINAGGGDDTVFGGDGDDSILGGSGADSLDGQTGDDTLRGQGGKDIVIGGEGNDTFEWDAASDGDETISSTSGFDQTLITAPGTSDTLSIGKSGSSMVVTLGSNDLTIKAFIPVVTIDAGAGSDTITIGDISGVPLSLLTVNGGADDDLIDATASVLGNVRLLMNGNDGRDTIRGGAGDETLDGGAGNDALFGGAGNDTLLGGDGNDALNGQAGDDSLLGGNNNDVLSGGDGNDVMRGGFGHDNMNGNSGNDTMEGNDGRDTLQGSDGNDSLDGGVGIDSLSGGNGNDTLDGGRNDDTILGDAGDDSILGNHGHDSIDAGAGSDTVAGGDGNDTIAGGDGNDLLTGSDGNDLINAGAGNDTATGWDGRDTIYGGSGNDVLLGDDGDDLLSGQGGADTLAGGQGADTLIGDASEINESFVLPDDLLEKLSLL